MGRSIVFTKYNELLKSNQIYLKYEKTKISKVEL